MTASVVLDRTDELAIDADPAFPVVHIPRELEFLPLADGQLYSRHNLAIRGNRQIEDVVKNILVVPRNRVVVGQAQIRTVKTGLEHQTEFQCAVTANRKIPYCRTRPGRVG